MPGFKGRSQIRLQPNDLDVPYTFEFPPCSAADANDGAIPYGDSVASCVVTAHDPDGNNVTTELITETSVANNIVTVVMKYPATSKDGEYHLLFVVTTTLGAKIEADFNRIEAVDLT